MKSFAALILLSCFAAAGHAQEFQSLFNGKDLSGWAGKPEFWSVQDGVIFGQTTKDKPTQGNTFLIWQGGEVKDFVFKAKVRFEGNNSGVQYRSERIGKPEDFAVKGYQADLHRKPEFFGMLYAEKWRGIVAKRFQIFRRLYILSAVLKKRRLKYIVYVFCRSRGEYCNEPLITSR